MAGATNQARRRPSASRGDEKKKARASSPGLWLFCGEKSISGLRPRRIGDDCRSDTMLDLMCYTDIIRSQAPF